MHRRRVFLEMRSGKDYILDATRHQAKVHNRFHTCLRASILRLAMLQALERMAGSPRCDKRLVDEVRLVKKTTLTNLRQFSGKTSGCRSNVA